jgi:hypothetical protein
VNHDQPPLSLSPPRTEDRRPERNFVRLPADRVAARAATARNLGVMADLVNADLARLDEGQQQQTIIKVEHERPVDLGGTGLKLLAPQGAHVSLAVLKEGETGLGKLKQKLTEFGTSPLRSGQPKHAQLDAIHKIAVGEPTDRLSDGLFSQYAALTSGADEITLEIEMTSLQQGRRQQREELEVIPNQIQQEFGLGRDGHFFEHEEYGNVCRAVIRCSGRMLKKLVEDPAWIRKITWFEERPKFKTFRETVDEFHVGGLGDIWSPSPDAPAVCVIDSGVTPQNPFLKSVVNRELLKSFLRSDPDNPFDSFGHGSGVASLVAYQAILIADSAVNQGKVWVASARIVTKDEELEDDRLFSVVLKEVVEYFRPRGVRIFNLSLGNRQLKWNQDSRRTTDRKSWVARTIDNLSREHDVIFVTCTGNLELREINDYVSKDCHYPAYLAERDSSILDPGQAALALTVGSIAPGTTVANNSPDTAVAEQNHASPFTRSGPGICRECKPELVDFGGNYARGPDRRVRPAGGLQVAIATHQETPAITHNCGTSFAAPRVAHKLALVLADLKALGIEEPSSALLKAFLVNSATYRTGHEQFIELLDDHKKGHWTNVLGYGQPGAARATDCNDYSCVFYFEGSLERNKVAFFPVPVPRELAGAGKKRLTVTVCSTPEVQKTGLKSYLGTTAAWRMFRGDASHEEVVAAMSKDEEGEGDSAGEEEEGETAKGPKELQFKPGVTRRSRGTVQHGVYEWTLHRPEYSEHPYTLAVGSYEKWGRQGATTLPYAVVVRLEDLSHSVKIYSKAIVAVKVRT